MSKSRTRLDLGVAADKQFVSLPPAACCDKTAGGSTSVIQRRLSEWLLSIRRASLEWSRGSSRSPSGAETKARPYGLVKDNGEGFRAVEASSNSSSAEICSRASSAPWDL